MRILVLGAGGPAGVNTCRALVAAGHDVYAEDTNPAHRAWCEATGAKIPKSRDRLDIDADGVIPQPDSIVRWAAENRDWLYSEFGMRTFLPSLATIETCQAKNRAATIWHEADLRGPVQEIVEPYPDWLHLAQEKLGSPFWLRAARGAGANKAIKVSQIGEAFHWIRFWQSRGVEVDWIAEPYLPGRDFAWTSIWYQGDLVACFLRERLEYLYPHLSPEGLTGTPTIARIVHDSEVTGMAEEAVLAIDDRPHGIFSVDLREDPDGVARPTEINAGRGFTTMGLWSLYDVNFTDIAARCAITEPEDAYIDPLPDGLTLSRHIDCGHVFTREPVLA